MVVEVMSTNPKEQRQPPQSIVDFFRGTDLEVLDVRIEHIQEIIDFFIGNFEKLTPKPQANIHRNNRHDFVEAIINFPSYRQIIYRAFQEYCEEQEIPLQISEEKFYSAPAIEELILSKFQLSKVQLDQDTISANSLRSSALIVDETHEHKLFVANFVKALKFFSKDLLLHQEGFERLLEQKARAAEICVV